MPLETLEFKTSLQRLLTALIIVLLPVTIFGLFLALEADSHVREMSGAHLKSLTRLAASEVSEYVNERVQDVGSIANDPSVVAKVTAEDQKYKRMSEDAARSQSEKIDRSWGTAEADATAKAILNSEISDMLRRQREMNARLLMVSVVDERGATVAATEKPGHYLQTEMESWRALYAEGKVAAHISDIRYDEQNRLNYISISFPVVQADTGRLIGAVNALVDVSGLFDSIHRVQVARTGHLFLVRDDGTVVSAPGITPAMKVKSDEYVAIRDAMGTVQGREAGFIQAVLPNRNAYLIGFADTGLKQAFTNLNWVVIASEEEGELFGTVRTVAHFAMVLLVLAVLMLAVLTAYIFLHRAQRMTDIESPPEEKTKSAAA